MASNRKTAEQYIFALNSPFLDLAVLITLFLSLLYIFQRYLQPYVPLPLFLKVEAAAPFLLVLCWLFLFPAFLIFQRGRIPFKICLVVIIVPLSCVLLALMLSSVDLLSTLQIGANRYHLVVYTEFGDMHRPCILYRCNAQDLACTEISSYYGECYLMKKAKLVLNPETNDVNVLVVREGEDEGFQLDYTYGKQPRAYMNRLTSGAYDYYLAWYHDFDTNSPNFKYMLYRCQKDSLACERLPFQYITRGLPYGYLENDHESGEIRIFVENRLIYTYGVQPVCHVENCSISY